MNQTYIYKNGQQLGPFDDTLIINSLTNGTFDYIDLCSREGWNEWKPLGEIYPRPQKTPFSQEGLKQARVIKKSSIKNWWSKPFGKLTYGDLIAFVVSASILACGVGYMGYIRGEGGLTLVRNLAPDIGLKAASVVVGIATLPTIIFIWAMRFYWRYFRKSEKYSKSFPQGPVIIFLTILGLLSLWGMIYTYNDSKYAKYRELEKNVSAHPYNKAGWIALANEEKRLGMDKCVPFALNQAENAIKSGKLEIKTILYLEKNQSMDEYNKSQERIKEIEEQMGETYQ